MTNDLIETSTIFIVDDNVATLDTLASYLGMAGFDIFVAKNGAAALEKIKRVMPDLVLLDIMMPIMNGFEVCTHLKNNPETKDIPIIFMTALSEIDHKMKGFEVGAVDYVIKPLEYKEVLARITTHITLRHLQKKLQTKNDQLQQQTLELQASNEELDAFARTVAHELKNPLTVIVGFASLIQMQAREQLSPPLYDTLDTIFRNGQRMSNIIDELLLLARMKNAVVDLKPLDMAAIIAESQERLADMIKEYQPQITLPATWPTALGYAPWIEEVWVNYISNALKYGGNPLQIKLGATPEPDGQVCFWIQDNGQGLNPDEKAQLFTEFTRLEHVEIKGYGLGLSIVRRIIKKLGGEVGVESEPGEGSTFYFTLPAK